MHMIEIVTLGSFAIKVNGADITDSFKKTKKLMQLLNLLIVNRNKPIPVDTICDIIWNDDAIDTYKALHNLVYRMRKYFEKHGERDSIIFNNRTYMLNTELDLWVDIHLFEDYYLNAQKPDITPAERIDLLLKAIELYNGEYIFNTICGDTHSIPHALWCRRMFSEAVCMFSDLCLENQEYDIMLPVCYRAISLEPLDEQIYLRAINGLRSKDMDGQATALIESFYDIMYREMGIRDCESLSKIYKELNGPAVNAKYNVGLILSELQEISSVNKSMFCNFDVFKNVYRYEVRQQERMGNLIFIILAEIFCASEVRSPDVAIANANKHFHECCMVTLRKGDMFAVYSPSQTLIMLILSSEEDLNIALDRLRNQFYSRVKNEKVYLKFDVHSSIP